MTRAQIASTIAYTLDWQGFTLEQRLVIGEAFADDLRLKGVARTRFLDQCHKDSEQAFETHTMPNGRTVRTVAR